MRKIILDLATTLDGFIEGADGATDWCVMDDDMDMRGFLSGIDTIFYGRASYDLWGNYQPGPDAGETERKLWSAVHSKKKYVFSGQDRQDPAATFISSGIAERVAEIRQQDGKDIWLYGGAQLIDTFVKLNLIDVYRLSVHPVVLGAGKPLFAPLQERINLELTGMSMFRSGVVQLVYTQAKAHSGRPYAPFGAGAE